MFDLNKLECSVETTKPIDFDEKWSNWLKEVHDVPNHIEIDHIEEEGFGQKIFFYYNSVKNTKIFAIAYIRNDVYDKPVIAYYHGHMGYIEHEWQVWHCMNLVAAGYNVVAIDMRFQGTRVEDHNEYKYTDFPSACYNIDDLENCYNKRLDQDALKIIDIISDDKIFPNLARNGIAVAGPSQGGGLSMMVSAMSDYPILASLSDVPSDCAIIDRIKTRAGKYGVIKDFIEKYPDLEDKVLSNQNYFDVINMADKIKCPIITSIGTEDDVCPPKYFYQAYKKINGYKELYPYEGYKHGGFEELHLPIKIKFIDNIVKNNK